MSALYAIGTYAAQIVVAHWLFGALLVAGAALVTANRRRCNAATRHLVWTLCLVAMSASLLVATAASVLTPLRYSSPAVSSAAPAGARSLGDLAPQLTRSAQPLEQRSVASQRTSRVDAEDSRRGLRSSVAGVLTRLGASLAWQPSGTASPTLNWLWRTAGWSALALWTLLLSSRGLALAFTLRSLHALRRSAAPVDHATKKMVLELAKRAGLAAVPSLFRHPALRGPVCVGLLRSRIGLPSAWPGELSQSARRHALLHELAHAARRDGVWTLMQRCCLATLALHPLTGLVTRRIDLAREQACDDWAMARCGGGAADYGDSLLEFAASSSPRAVEEPLPLLAAGYLPTVHQLERRLQHMLDPANDHESKPRQTPLFLGVLASAALFLVAVAVWPRYPGAVQQLVGSTSAAQHAPRFDRGAEDARNADDSMLYLAIRLGDVERVRSLLDDGENVHQIWPGDGSPLIEAARRRSPELVRLLVERGAEVDRGVGGDGTALIAAARTGDTELVDLLLEYGADIDHAGPGGDGNPLIAASLAGDVDMATFLLQRGATLDLHVPDDDTPLVNAAQAGHLELVRLYLEMGADPNIQGDYDRRLERVRTPLNQALARGHEEVARVLRAAGARE